jgi:hypothetical protein
LTSTKCQPRQNIDLLILKEKEGEEEKVRKEEKEDVEEKEEKVEKKIEQGAVR